MSVELEKIAYVYGDVCLRKQRRKRQKLLITELLLDYAKNSTLHGLRYIAEKGLATIEKLFWITTFVISVVLCSLLIKNVYLKWKNSPVIVTVSERLVSVGEVPFPSVTICPQIKSKATVYNITKEMNRYIKLNNESIDIDTGMLSDIAMICSYPDDVPEDIRRLYTDASIIDSIDKVAPNISSTLGFCFSRDDIVECSKIFKNVYTAEGLCFNMNGLAAEEMFRDTVQSDYKYSERDTPMRGWSIEDGSYTNKEADHFPWRGNENSGRPDLQVIMTSLPADQEVLCNGINSGYKIYIQHPTDLPQSSMYYYAALEGQVSSLAISFHRLSTSDALKDYDSDVRQCYFDKPLKYFKMYTAQNCRAECLSNYTFEMCRCVGFFMPHDNSSQICAEKSISCIMDAYNYMSTRELQLGLAKSGEGCRCLPACNSVEYDAEILKTDFHLSRLFKKLNISDFPESTKFSKIEMYFKKPQFVSMHRSELFGLTDFLSNIGGLLGVFLGFSFLSLVEVIYFITLRLGCILKRDLKEEKKNKHNTAKTGYVDKN